MSVHIIHIAHLLQDSRTRRPTPDDLMNEAPDDQGLDRRR
jgi:hypothetical protein